MKKRNLIILALISLILVAAAVLMPEILWNRHIRQLTLTNDIRAFEMPENFHIPNAKELSEDIRSGRIFTYESNEADHVRDFETAKNALNSFFEYCESDVTLKYCQDILSTCNLEYTVTNIDSVLSDSTPQYYSFLSAGMTNYFADYYLFIELTYEQKTQTIVGLTIFIAPDKDLYSPDNSRSEFEKTSAYTLETDRYVLFDDFMSAASKYYASCGIDPEYIERNYDNTSFYMSINENVKSLEKDYSEKF